MTDLKEEIRRAYEAGEGTFQKLSEKYNVKIGTIKSWAKRDKDEGNQWVKVATKQKTKSEKVATKNEDISWIDLENEYVTDIRRKPNSLEDLSKKYNIPLQTIFDYSASHNWSYKRREYKENTKEKVKAKSAELISMDAAKAIAKHFKISDKLLNALDKVTDDETQFYKVVEKLRTGYGPGEFKEEIVTETLDAINDAKVLNLVNAVEKLQKMQRQTLGILDEKDKQKLELEKSKVDDLDEGIEYVIEDDADEEEKEN